MSKHIDGVYAMAVVYCAEPMAGEHEEIKVNPIDYTRVSGNVQIKPMSGELN